MKTKYIVTYTGNDCMMKHFDFPVEEKAEAIATLKNLALRYKDVELLSVDSDDPDITYNLTKKYL